ncbi:MAG: hypothetical protein PVJ28_11140 [Acidimicrobiia bacterium]|jgi:hypothetical protein
MLTPKLIEMVHEQNELAQKLVDGTATDAEKDRLSKLTAAIKAATGKADGPKTEYKAMKLSEFQAYIEQETAKAATNPDPVSLQLLRKNLAAVKALRDSNPELADDHVITIEVKSSTDADDRIAALEAQVAELTTKLTETPAADEPAGKQDTETSQKLAMEAIDALIGRYESLKQKIEAGSVTAEDLEKAWEGNWDLQRVIEGAVAVLAKAEALKAVIDAIKPTLEKLAGPEDEGGEGDGDEGGDESGDEGGDGDSGEGDEVGKGGVNWGGDLSGTSKGGNADYSRIKKAGGMNGDFAAKADKRDDD